jgi:predicted alpha-1,2-mannosidase
MPELTPVDQVNLFIGTAGDHGQLYPGPETPFGMVKPSPDTWSGTMTGTAHAGYDYNDTELLGFSHLRFSGVGNMGIGGNILLLPMPAGGVTDPEQYHTPIDKESEVAEAGYYDVTFSDAGIRAELTATDHTAVHRYTFPLGVTPHVLVDLMRGFRPGRPAGLPPVRDAHCLVTGPDEILGEVTANGMSAWSWYRVFFCIRFDRHFREIRLYPEDGGARFVNADRDGKLAAVARFAESPEPLVVRVALSHISMGQARRTLNDETADSDFDCVRARCRADWAKVLNQIQVTGPLEYRELLHTHLYRACLSPFNVTSKRGSFMGDDQVVHRARNHVQYNGWSLWDTYRTKFPLLTLVQPERMADMVESLVRSLEQRMSLMPDERFPELTGFLPCPTVRMELANVVLLDAHRKGITTSDPRATFQVMKEIALNGFPPESGGPDWVPGRPDLTCEYAYDNWAAACMAEILEQKETAAFFHKRGRFYHNVWDDEIRFFRGRDAAGNWLEFPEDPAAVVEDHVYEGSMWHWRWNIVHDIAGMTQCMGGRQAYLEALTYFFENNLHNHGNEPGLHAPWLFAAAGAPWKSQQWVRRILTEEMTQRYGTHDFLPEPVHRRIYSNSPDGFIPEMDDDDGCMTAWYVLSAIGLFPVCPGRPKYALGLPIFEETTLETTSGRPFHIRVRNYGPENGYIQSAWLNSQRIDRAWLRHDEIMAGGELLLNAGPEPRREWGAEEHPPW